MTPKGKILLGSILIAPVVGLIVLLLFTLYRNPEASAQQVFDEYQWIWYFSAIIAAPGAFLLASGFEEYDGGKS